MRCAGVQKVSRPIVMCHEMSQYTPTITHTAATTTAYACQTRSPTRATAMVSLFGCSVPGEAAMEVINGGGLVALWIGGLARGRCVSNTPNHQSPNPRC